VASILSKSSSRLFALFAVAAPPTPAPEGDGGLAALWAALGSEGRIGVAQDATANGEDGAGYV
jgi:hypothetical protein